MNKSNLVKKVSEDLVKKLQENQAKAAKLSESAVTIFFDEIKKAVVNGEKVGIRGLGIFWAKRYKSYSGRNPKSGQKVQVPQKELPVFKASPSFIERLNDELGTPLSNEKQDN